MHCSDVLFPTEQLCNALVALGWARHCTTALTSTTFYNQ